MDHQKVEERPPVVHQTPIFAKTWGRLALSKALTDLLAQPNEPPLSTRHCPSKLRRFRLPLGKQKTLEANILLRNRTKDEANKKENRRKDNHHQTVYQKTENMSHSKGKEQL